MKAFRRLGPLTIMTLLVLLLAACGGTTTATTTGTTPAKTTAATNGNVAPATTMQGIAITAATTGNAAALIHLGQATVDGKQVNVLLTSKGFAVYTYKADAALTATCVAADGCAKDWPPVLVAQGMTMAASSVTLPKQLSVHQTANGAQVFYDGHALYTYAADTQAGNATGNGQDMQWYLADSMLTMMTTTTTTAMTQGITIAADMTGNAAALIHTGKATVNGQQVTVLLTSKGFAVYYYKPDTAFKATCVAADGCAKDWPPVLAAQGMTTASSSVTLPKQLSVHQTANGAQVFYDGHALYTYATDTQAGNAMGNGQDMQWYLVNVTAAAMTTNVVQGGITITPAMAGNMNAFIHTGKAAINANLVNVLITNKNFALYYYKPDTAFKATCTAVDGCSKDWPPLLAPQGMMTVSSSVTLPRQLSVHQTANGAQVFYDGHALYTYATDTQAGNAQGRGQDMQWYMVGFLL